MRKVLLRIVFDNVWACESVGNELHVGYGSVIAAWIVIAAIGLAILWRATKDKAQVLSSLVFWGIIPAGLIVASFAPVAEKGVPLFGYGFMLFVGFSSATFLASRRAKSVGMAPDVIWDLMMWLLIPGIIGARIIYLMQYGDKVFAGKQGLEILKAAVALWDGGIVFYGCVIGGVLGLTVYCRRNNIRALQLLDVIMPSVFFGLGFGRIGCFLYGCCFGAVCAQPWAVHFPQDSMTFSALADRSVQREMAAQRDPDLAADTKLLEADGVPVSVSELKDLPEDVTLTTIGLHPSQLYSSALAFALAGLLMWYFPRRRIEGSVLALGWMIYPINRFVLEIIRDDEKGRLGTELTFSQLTSIALLLSGCAFMWWLQRNHAASADKPAVAKAGKPQSADAA